VTASRPATRDIAARPPTAAARPSSNPSSDRS
jgi:hypothetical protein